MQRLVCLVIGYFCGSFLTAELIARRRYNVSVFDLGDGNPGMANIGHELGKPAAIVCLLGDILKTVIPVLISRLIFPGIGVSATGWAGFGVTLGHILPFWHGFRGGKGVTTIASTIILMSPLWGILSGIVGIVTVVLSGYLCVGAMAVVVFFFLASFFVLPLDCSAIAAVFVVLSAMAHGSKLMGIRRGTTRKAGMSITFWEWIDRLRA